MTANEIWARGIIRRWDPDYRPRWEVFDSLLRSLQNDKMICLEIGSGSSGTLESALQFKLKIHSDLIRPLHLPTAGEIPYIQMDTYNLPFKNYCADLILLRFVVEHLAEPEKAIEEFRRILKPGGQILILTTNLSSPLIFLPKILPYPWRKKMIQWLFNAQETDVFPTYHRLNQKRKVTKLIPDFRIISWNYLQDANWLRRWWFLALFFWHLLTKWLHLEFLRSNFITLLKKI